MQIQSERPEHSVIALSIPTVTARMLEHVADTRGVHIGKMAAILLQLAVIREQVARRKLFAEGERG